MKKFITKVFLIGISIGLVLFLLLNISTYVVKNRNFTNYNCESNTLFLKENTKYDLLFLGISHGREFSRHKNHVRIENILDAKIINFAQGKASCGANEQLFYLDYFYYKKNKAQKIVYILSPSMLFATSLDLASNTFDQEVFNLQFIFRYAQFESDNKSARIMSYLQRKLHPVWLLKKPFTAENMPIVVDTINMQLIAEGQNMVFNGSVLNTVQFEKSIKIIEKTIQLAKSNKSEVFLVIPPALFGKWRGHLETLNFAKKMGNKYANVTIFDASEKVLNNQYYYDSHHLNTNGIVFFTENYLQKLLKN